MAEKILQTKIALLYKTLSDWEANPSYKPLKGEVCIAEAPLNTTDIHSAPTVLFKVGDGSKTFGELNWASARASDVYAWAKKANLDFGDLDEAFMTALDAEILEKAGTLSTLFRIVETETDSHEWKLQKSVNDGEWTDVSTFKVSPDVFAKVDYVDQSITNAIDYFIQEIENEHNGRVAGDNLKVDKEISSTNGKARIFNEADGGGAKFEHTDGSEAFVGVNDGGKDGLMAQIYADIQQNGKWVGAKLDVTNGGIYYTVGDKAFAERAVAENELATIGDINGGIAGLADIARTGNVNDLIQTQGDILVLNCNF